MKNNSAGNAMLPKFKRLYNYAIDRARHRRAYHSPLDILKAFYIRSTIVDGAKVNKRRLIAGLRVRPRGAAEGVYLRAGDSDFMAFKEIFEHGEYDTITKWNLPDSATVLDLGGNIGLASVYFSSVLPRSKVLVVEPDPENCRLIRMNCAKMVEEGRLNVIAAFAAAEDGTAGIDRSTARSWAYKMTNEPGSSGDEQIRCIGMASLIRESGFSHVDLLKCDVEGAESALFANCRDWIGSVSHLIVETHAPYQNADLFKDLNSAGWTFEVAAEFKQHGVETCFLRRLESPVGGSGDPA